MQIPSFGLHVLTPQNIRNLKEMYVSIVVSQIYVSRYYLLYSQTFPRKARNNLNYVNLYDKRLIFKNSLLQV